MKGHQHHDPNLRLSPKTAKQVLRGIYTLSTDLLGCLGRQSEIQITVLGSGAKPHETEKIAGNQITVVDF